MKYTSEIVINLSRKDCIEKLNNPSNLKHWQRGLVDYELLEGTPGKIGSKTRLNYLMDNRKMELIETISKTNLPDSLHLTYSTKGMLNIQDNFFEVVSENSTKWLIKNEFLPTNFMMRMMLLLMPGAFKKQSKKYLEDFKNFAENGQSVSEKK